MAGNRKNLPLLPGYSFNGSIGKEYFGRRQFCSLIGDVCVLNKDPLAVYRPSLYLKGSSSDIPPWVLFDKQMLSFDAVFQSDATNRFVKVLYFLEDGTMKVVEPKTVNSGLNQGTIVGRQRIPCDNSVGYFEATDLNVGKEIEIYKKTFLLTNCDKFTRTFLTKIGTIVPEPINIPKQSKFGRESQNCHNSLSSKPVKSSVQFLEYDKKILRFYGYWNENDYIHKLELLYYLADDTIEIYETDSKTGKKHIFLQKGSLPKNLQQCLVANFKSPIEVYEPSDLMIGTQLNVYGRTIHLTDCDSFTKEYYKAKYGIEHFERILIPGESDEQSFRKSYRKELPPWNGIGSFDDSAGNCDSLLPKAPRCDFEKFLTKDSIGDDSHILRFMARLISNISDDGMRQFVISYYLRDDTISVFEMKVRNSGFQGGMIFKRNCVILPGQNLYVNQKPFCYNHKDMWIGNKLIINDHNFLLVNADEYTLKYMEQHPGDFEKSNIVLIVDKIRQKLLSVENGYKDFVAKNMNHADASSNNSMPIMLFECALKEICGDLLTEHEFITILRFFRQNAPTVASDREHIRAIINSHLIRNLWEDNDRLLEHFRYLDEENSGYLSYKDVRYALIANKLPVPSEELNQMLDVILMNDKNELSYIDVIDFLNFQMKPSQKMIALPSKSTKKLQTFLPENLIAERASEDIYVKWLDFINALNLEYLLTANP